MSRESDPEVMYNVVRLSHYTCEFAKEIRLKKLFEERIDRLQKCNITISFEQLLDMYGIKTILK